jgi:hypothetical protein
MAAKNENNILNKKDVGALVALPVDSGQTIYQNTLVGVDTDGLLKNIALANVQTLRVVGVVADDSANLTPAATTADGSILADRTSADAGDKTVRMVWLQGRFLLNFGEAVAQTDLGKLAYAKNNNDCYLTDTDAVLVGTIVGIYSTSQAWVELNKYYPEYPDVDLVVLKGALVAPADNTAGGICSIANPFAADAIVESFAFDIDKASTGPATGDFGIGTVASSDTLLDGVTLNGAVTGLKTIGTDGGTNGKAFRPISAADLILGTASADATGLVGTYKAVIRKY